MRTPGQRGRYGRWLVAARKARHMDTADDALTALRAAGIAISDSTYREYEAGSKPPSRNHLPQLIDFWGEPPDEEDDLADAIRLQAAAIQALADAQMSPTDLAQMIGEAIGLAVREALRAAPRDAATPRP
jgi:transcriptional regulator with XRE-family HTH domain